jgi:hypothetical protein
MGEHGTIAAWQKGEVVEVGALKTLGLVLVGCHVPHCCIASVARSSAVEVVDLSKCLHELDRFVL